MVREDMLGNVGSEVRAAGAGEFLYRATMANAVVTAACGVVAIGGANTWVRAFALREAWLPYALGALYVGFGGLLALTAARRRPLEATAITAMDAGYGVASVAAIALFPGAMNGAGREAVLFVAALVAGLVAAQSVGIARVRRAG